MTARSWWGEDFERTISSYKEGRHAEGMEACERLLSSVRPLPPDIETFTRQNQTWYLGSGIAGIGDLFVEPPYIASREITLGKSNLVPIGWSLFNPSIAADNHGNLSCIVRSSNYSIERSGRYALHDTDGIIRTRNYLGSVDPKTLGFGDWGLIDTSEVDGSQIPYLVQGFEDARLFYGDGTWQFLATVRDRHPDGRCQIARCSLDGVVVTTMDILESPIPGRHEKNWMPLSRKRGQLQGIVYQVGCPAMILDRRRGGWFTWSPWITRSFRGGAAAYIGPGNEILALVHEAIDMPVGAIPRRVYTHRFVRMVNGIDVVGISRPFCFETRQIEFAAGMVKLENDLVISYGTNDARAKLLRVPLDEAMRMLKPPLPEES